MLIVEHESKVPSVISAASTVIFLIKIMSFKLFGIVRLIATGAFTLY